MRECILSGFQLTRAVRTKAHLLRLHLAFLPGPGLSAVLKMFRGYFFIGTSLVGGPFGFFSDRFVDYILNRL